MRRTYLIDNGSLRPESILNLRKIALELSALSEQEVLPVSLLHSSKVSPEKLGGKEAMVWERQMKRDLKKGFKEFLIIPFFFGPTAAILNYMPERLLKLKEKFADFKIYRTSFLAGEKNETKNDLIQLLANLILETQKSNGLKLCPVILVDHGSPLKSVTQVRNRIAKALEQKLQNEVDFVHPASMERRDGARYKFNEPLLANKLKEDSIRNREIILSYLFLSPGRHAGSGGDIDTICQRAMAEDSSLRIKHTPLVGEHPDIVHLLKSRLEGKIYPIR